MKKVLAFALAAVFLAAAPSRAQSVTQVFVTSGPSIGPMVDLTRIFADIHTLQWRISGTASSCSVQIDGSSDGKSWTLASVMASQTCTANGEFSQSNTVTNFARIDVTVLSGNGVSVNFLYAATSSVASHGGSTAKPTSPSTGLLAPQQGLVQSAAGQNGTSGAIPAIALLNNVVKGDMLFASEQGHVSSAPTVGVSDTLGNTWTPLPAAGSSGGNTAQIQTFYAIANSSGADSMQITMSGPSTFDLTLVFSEYAGINTLDQSVSASSTSSGNITTTQPNEVLIAFGSGVIAGNNKFPIMAAGGGANNYSARAIVGNGNNDNNSVGSILEDNLAPTAGTYSAGFNNGGEATAGTVIQLASFYSSVPLGSLFRPLASSDLQPEPINLNCIPAFYSMGCLNLKLDASSGVGVSRISFSTNTCGNMLGGQLFSPICIEIPILHNADTDRILWLATGGPDTQCNFGWRMDGDGFLVMDGTCSLALTNPNTTVFGSLRVTNNQSTGSPDLDVGPSSPKTGGAPVAQIHDSSSTLLFTAPDIESLTNHPSFPVGVTGKIVGTTPGLFAALPTCNGATEGTIGSVTDSTLATWGSAIAGGGANHVGAYCDGTNWTVYAK